MGEMVRAEGISDEELMMSFMTGSEDAFDDLVGRYGGRITNFIHRQVSHFATAEELAQDTFLAVYRKKHTFKAGHRFSSWLYKIAINVCRMHFRKMKGAPPTVSIEESQEEGAVGLGRVLVDEGEDARESLSRKDAEEKLQEAMMGLPAKQRQVFALSFYEGLSYEEIGRLLGCSPGTVASRKHTAVKRLGSRLRKLAPGLLAPGEGREDKDETLA